MEARSDSDVQIGAVRLKVTLKELLVCLLQATPSNCGDVLKLKTPTMARNRSWGQDNDLGYGKSSLDDTSNSRNG